MTYQSIKKCGFEMHDSLLQPCRWERLVEKIATLSTKAE